MLKVNCLIANHNYGQWIIDAIESAINQSYPDLSITIVDDGSTDDSWLKIHEQYFRKIPHEKILPSEFDIKIGVFNNRKITAIKLPNCTGPSNARNVGIDFTINDTDAFLILDADDIAYKNKVERLVSEYLILPSITGAVYADYDIYNVSTNLKQREYKEDFSFRRLLSDCIVHSGSLISSEALKTVKDHNGYYDRNMRVAEDWDLWIRIAQKFMIVHVPESLTLVRATPKDSTNSVDPKVWQQCWNMIGMKYAHLRQSVLY